MKIRQPPRSFFPATPPMICATSTLEILLAKLTEPFHAEVARLKRKS
jgi:hypothetical protein